MCEESFENVIGCMVEKLKKLLVPTGTIIIRPTAVVPHGYLECDGSEISREDYSELFKVLGTLYGEGDSSITFNLPDLRGEFIRGFDHNREIDKNRDIGTAQESTGIRTLIDNYPRDYPIGTFAIGASNIDERVLLSNNGRNETIGDNNEFYIVPSTVAHTGQGDNSGFKIRPRNIAMMYCIKY